MILQAPCVFEFERVMIVDRAGVIGERAELWRGCIHFAMEFATTRGPKIFCADVTGRRAGPAREYIHFAMEFATSCGPKTSSDVVVH